MRGGTGTLGLEDSATCGPEAGGRGAGEPAARGQCRLAITREGLYKKMKRLGITREGLYK